MKLDTKLGFIVLIEFMALVGVFSMMVLLEGARVSSYRLWEIFPAVLAALITTFGIKEMRRKT